MAQFANDTFVEEVGTEVDLQTHTSDSGHTWTAPGGIDIDVAGDFVKALPGANNREFAYMSVTPPAADYSVTLDVNVLDTNDFTISGPVAQSLRMW